MSFRLFSKYFWYSPLPWTLLGYISWLPFHCLTILIVAIEGNMILWTAEAFSHRCDTLQRSFLSDMEIGNIQDGTCSIGRGLWKTKMGRHIMDIWCEGIKSEICFCVCFMYKIWNSCIKYMYICLYICVENQWCLGK